MYNACHQKTSSVIFFNKGSQVHVPSLTSRHVSSGTSWKLIQRHQRRTFGHQQWQREHLVVANAQGRKGATEQKASKVSQRKAGGPLRDSSDEEEGTGWGLFDWSAYQVAWEIPWGASTLVLGFLAWAISFALVGLLFVPLCVELLGVETLRSLPAVDKAYLLLFNQAVETAVGLGVIALFVRRYLPLPDDLLVASLRQPLTPSQGWLAWGLLGVLLSPFDVGAAAFTAQAFGYDDVGGRGTAEGVASIISLDLPTYLSLFLVTAVLAPILEETVFRGFVLTSLTKWFPVPLAVLISAITFGAAHLTPRDFPQLTALGILLGFTYVRSRNLLTPMMIHGAWNGTVLSLLFLLASYGVDVPEFLAGSFIPSPLLSALLADGVLGSAGFHVQNLLS